MVRAGCTQGPPTESSLPPMSEPHGKLSLLSPEFSLPSPPHQELSLRQPTVEYSAAAMPSTGLVSRPDQGYGRSGLLALGSCSRSRHQIRGMSSLAQRTAARHGLPCCRSGYGSLSMPVRGAGQSLVSLLIHPSRGGSWIDFISSADLGTTWGDTVTRYDYFPTLVALHPSGRMFMLVNQPGGG